MPRVISKTKSNRGKDYFCRECGTKILPGEKYFEYSFFRGSTFRHCAKHYPRGSNLTTSETLQSALATIEKLEDELRCEDITREEAIDELNTAADDLDNVVSEIDYVS